MRIIFGEGKCFLFVVCINHINLITLNQGVKTLREPKQVQSLRNQSSQALYYMF